MAIKETRAVGYIGQTDDQTDTKDKVYLLNFQEENAYLPEYADRICRPTDYACAKGATMVSGSVDWWLQESGYLDGKRAVRPALMIDLKSGFFAAEHI